MRPRTSIRASNGRVCSSVLPCTDPLILEKGFFPLEMFARHPRQHLQQCGRTTKIKHGRRVGACAQFTSQCLGGEARAPVRHHATLALEKHPHVQQLATTCCGRRNNISMTALTRVGSDFHEALRWQWKHVRRHPAHNARSLEDLLHTRVTQCGHSQEAATPTVALLPSARITAPLASGLPLHPRTMPNTPPTEVGTPATRACHHRCPSLCRG